jgi:hypothetical protein
VKKEVGIAGGLVAGGLLTGYMIGKIYDLSRRVPRLEQEMTDLRSRQNNVEIAVRSDRGRGNYG